MHIYHIKPKENYIFQTEKKEPVEIREICACLVTNSWEVLTATTSEVIGLDGYVRQYLESQGAFFTGAITVKNELTPGLTTQADTNILMLAPQNLTESAPCSEYDEGIPSPDDFVENPPLGESVDNVYGEAYGETDSDDLLYEDKAYLKACQAVSGSKSDDKNIMGRTIKTKPMAISAVIEEGSRIVLSGKVVKLEFKELRTKRVLMILQIADKTNGITCKKYFETADESRAVEKNARSGMQVIVRGDVKFDKYENDYVMYVNDIQRIEEAVDERMDNSKEKRVELHLHTKMSQLDALVNVKDLIKRIKKWGHPAVAITDHGVVQAFPEAQAIASLNGVKVIYGVEGYVFDQRIDKSYHIIILAKNMVGIRNLYRLISISHLQYIYRDRPRIPRDVLMQYREGLIFGSACSAGELMSAVVNHVSYDQLKEVASFYDYLEIQPTTNNDYLVRGGKIADEEGLRDLNRTICKLGEDMAKPVVATCDVHFMDPEDKIYREVMMTGKHFSDAAYQPDIFLRTTEEMLAEFQYLGKDKAYEVVVTNSRLINDDIEELKPIPREKLYSPKIEGAEEDLRAMCYKKSHEWYGNPLPAIVEQRLQEELHSIIGNGFSVLYYIAHRLVKKSLDEGYLVGSRGSVGSSFVATMADITEVNPLPPHYRCPECQYSEFITDGSVGGGFDLPDKKCPHCGIDMKKDGHDIPFAIFLGFDGDKVPDIDLNFSGEYQPNAHKYTEELFGHDNVFRAGTIGTVKDKTAYGYVMKYAESKGIKCNDAFINSLLSGFTAVKNTTGQHPGGVMVIPREMDIHYFTPVQYPANKKESGIITTHFDYHSIEGRLVKLDILGHDDPTIIRMLEDLTGVDALTIPFDDKGVLSLFESPKALGVSAEDLGSKVGTFGVPEYGTKFVREMLVDTQPKTFSDLVRISGFSHGTNVWLDNAKDLIRSGKVKLNEAVSTRDDVMNYLMQKGVEPIVCFKVMENVRKGRGIEKIDKQGKPTTDYISKLKEKQVPQWFIDSCLKISYLFPRAHAVAYVMMAFRIAWFKINYPLAYYAAFFTIRAKAFDSGSMIPGLATQRKKLKVIEAKGREASDVEKSLQTSLELAVEMSLRGFQFSNIDLERSEARKFTIVDGKLMPPLCAIEGLGETAAEAIVASREKGSFTSKADLKRRGKVSQTIIDWLADNGCLADMPEDEQLDLFAL